MRSFFKTFFAAFLAIAVFAVIIVFVLVRFIGNVTTKNKPAVKQGSILVIDLQQSFHEQQEDNPLSLLSGSDDGETPGVYDLVRLIEHASTDRAIKGIYLSIGNNPNGFASSSEIRTALSQFKRSGKFILAYGDMISQRAYAIANVADKIYVSPAGYFEWLGMDVQYVFLKGALDKLEIQPRIFYAGKFKSATEPLRADRMSDANKLQTTAWLEDIYADLLRKTSEMRKIDTAQLRQHANSGSIVDVNDALQFKLVDGVKYDDEVRDEIKQRLSIGKYDVINFISIGKYMTAVDFKKTSGDKIALIYAEGDIVDGKGSSTSIEGDTYRNLIRKARLDKGIKAIVIRINSGGGSALASENMWREVSLATKEKPVLVSFGDVAASGGYYMACAADSIFAQPTTITGSIGIFGLIPDLSSFFKNKLGVTFDGVKTGRFADIMSATRPMTDEEKSIVQGEIEKGYQLFKQRVAEGRKMDTAMVENIAQGRVWTGQRAIAIGLIDRFAGIDETIKSAARMAKLDKYQLMEFPEQESMLDRIFRNSPIPVSYSVALKQELGEDYYKVFEQLKKIRDISSALQARLPFEFIIR